MARLSKIVRFGLTPVQIPLAAITVTSRAARAVTLARRLDSQGLWETILNDGTTQTAGNLPFQPGGCPGWGGRVPFRIAPSLNELSEL